MPMLDSLGNSQKILHDMIADETRFWYEVEWMTKVKVAMVALTYDGFISSSPQKGLWIILDKNYCGK
ncbi:hypothetical protein L6164_012904 [Bauhinia variegata]|uniref:Uncharacterized protein n=1 Tax=Bauhinia variegata TaxID=167791 RepID=A0ACB9PBF1_BAUVA|nr:hypothetical protein L6164_012904 [Bauhinia variegata]